MPKLIGRAGVFSLLLASCNNKNEQPIGGSCSFDSIARPVMVSKVSPNERGALIRLKGYSTDSLDYTITAADYKAILKERGREVQPGDTFQILQIKSLSPSCTEQNSVLRFGTYRAVLNGKY